jgi:hypothetical protein
MKSPFPGMDPFLERSWGDVHTRLVASSSTALNRLLPQDLIARVEEQVAIETGGDGNGPATRANVIPDARIFEMPAANAKETAAGAGVALAPYRLELLDEPATERFIHIIDVSNRERLVTVLEFLSPSNKLGDGRRAFLRKRRALLDGGVNVVEIDLVRAGNWRRLLGRYFIPEGGIATYRASIHVPGDEGGAFLHPIALRAPLPAVKIPLRLLDAPCELALQPLIEEVYEAGRYGRTIDYAAPCDPPLGADDAAWAQRLPRST